MSAADQLLLQQDMQERGLSVPLDVCDGVVLDGRARLVAARALGWETVAVNLVQPPDPVAHMLLAMLRRQHLTASQLAALAVELDVVRQARRDGVATLPPAGKMRDLAAELVGVSPRTVQDAATVRAADAELFEQVKAGKVAAHTAARRVRRTRRDAALPAPPPIPTGPFDVMLADPPWQLGNPDGKWAPENHYPTQPPEQILALRPPAANNGMLFLWVPVGLLPLGLQVMQAWGFAFVAEMVWVKESIGLGNTVRFQHEPLLVGRKGNFPQPDPEDRPSSVVHAHRRRHSQKPETFYELIERMYPAASKLELFARNTRPGWASWGNEVTS